MADYVTHPHLSGFFITLLCYKFCCNSVVLQQCNMVTDSEMFQPATNNLSKACPATLLFIMTLLLFSSRLCFCMYCNTNNIKVHYNRRIKSPWRTM